MQHAQARFLRGHFNFELVKTFRSSSVNYSRELCSARIQSAKCFRLADLYAAIEADFTYAKANLPAAYQATYTQRGRPLSWAAQAFLGKAQLFQQVIASMQKLNLEDCY